MQAQRVQNETGTPGDATGRELIVIEHPAGVTNGRPAAEFVTQLIASYRKLPAYRARRREAPGKASASYTDHPLARHATFDQVF